MSHSPYVYKLSALITMITNKLYGVREAVIALAVLVALALMGTAVGTAFAQTTSSFTPPSGYTQMGTSGIYYNSENKLYYNPVTGQYSTIIPLGPASMVNGVYTVPSGYYQYSGGPYYYNNTTGYYYDPSTGFYSPTAPTNTGVSHTMAVSYNPATAPGTPPSSGNTTTTTTGTSGSTSSSGLTANSNGTYTNSSGQITDANGIVLGPGITGSTVTPGVPNTGAGGNTTATFALLAVLGALAATGAILLGRRVV
jgi:hypothetical protein